MATGRGQGTIKVNFSAIRGEHYDNTRQQFLVETYDFLWTLNYDKAQSQQPDLGFGRLCYSLEC